MAAPRLPGLLFLVACASTPTPHAQSPAPTYPVPAAVGRLVVDDDAFASFAGPLRAGVESDLARGDLRDPQAVRDRRFILALLDALDDRWPEAVIELDRIAATEDKPAARIMTGLTIRVWADARGRGGDTPEAFRGALERKLATMPLGLVRDQLVMLRMMGRVFSPAVCERLVDESLGDEARSGRLSLDSAQAVAFQRYAVLRLVRVGKVIDEVLEAHGVGLAEE